MDMDAMFHAVEDANYANALRGLDEVDPEDGTCSIPYRDVHRH